MKQVNGNIKDQKLLSAPFLCMQAAETFPRKIDT